MQPVPIEIPYSIKSVHEPENLGWNFEMTKQNKPIIQIIASFDRDEFMKNCMNDGQPNIYVILLDYFLLFNEMVGRIFNIELKQLDKSIERPITDD